MHDDFSDRTKDFFSNSMVISSTFLDPRYRKFHFIKNDKERENFINKAKNYILSTYLSKLKPHEQSHHITPPPAKKKKPSKENNFSLLCNDNDVDDNNAGQSINEKVEIESEINNYFSMKIQVTEHSNPLEFYKNNQLLFKRLSKFSKMVFSITASSTASEVAFSNAKNIISEQRNRLTPNHAEELVMISHNKRLGILV